MARYILPFFRSYIARQLVQKHGFTQRDAAQKLGTTQAAISQYLNSKRGLKGGEGFEFLLPMIQFAAAKTAERIRRDGIDAEEVFLSFCSLCKLLQQETSTREKIVKSR